MAKNIEKARAKEAARRAAEGAVKNEPQTGGNEAAEGGQGGVVQFNIDQLFAALGAKDFELTMLRAEVNRLNQVVTTYKNIVKNMETEAIRRSGGETAA